MSKVHLIKPDAASELVRQGEDGNFSELFKLDHIRNGESLKMLQNLGGELGLASLFGINLKNGIQDNDQAILMRQKYGANLPLPTKLTPLWRLIVFCLEDLTLQILIVAALISTTLGLIEGEGGWYEGCTIFIAILLIIGITAGNNYAKERQFAKLQSKLNEVYTQVKRGGEIITIDIKDIVVGDVMLFQIGDIFHVDGLYLHGSEVKIDESAMTGESDEMFKSNIEGCLHEHSERNPLLISGTKVNEGTGEMLVLNVGQNTVQSKMKELEQEDTTPTPLQIKLEAVAQTISKIGVFVALVTFTILLIQLFYDYSQQKEQTFWDQFWHLECLSKILDFFMIGVTIIVVAVPEGLPLAVTITLAFSVNKMKDEQNLVKTLSACEVMGSVNNICSDKTGTLTLNQMKVTAFYGQGQKFKDHTLGDSKGLNKNYLDLLASSYLYNSNAYPKKNANGTFQQIGNKTECALIEFCDQLGYTLHDYRPSDNILRVIPLNSKRKMMLSIVKIKDEIYLFSKGASEIVLEKCTKWINQDGNEIKLESDEFNNISNNIQEYANQALRTLGNAYKKLNINVNQNHDYEEISEDELMTDLTFINLVGIKDPVRPDVPPAIKQCVRSGIIVRMVTGDNICTAKAIAKDCGILSSDEQHHDYECLEGSKFRQLTGGLIKTVVNGEPTQQVKELFIFQQIATYLRVLARATPEDKFILATGLKQLNNVIAVTGDGTNDAPALRKADVGFAMGITGTDVCKDAADIILLDDNFSSIITACKWGRNIYNCIRKFLQFQLTVNVVALFMCILGSAFLSQAPLTSIQMLWVNLIMNTFAALALATEPPSERLLNRKPQDKSESIVNAIMYRTVIGGSVYQIIIMCIILFAPEECFESQDFNELPIERRLTMFFQTFVLTQICNSISCRKLDDQSLNPFSELCNNLSFWMINILEIIIQYLMILYGGTAAGVCEISLTTHILCWVCAIGGMLWAIFVRTLPLRWFSGIHIFSDFVDEDKLDETLPSLLRRRSTLRMGSVLYNQRHSKKSIQIHQMFK